MKIAVYVFAVIGLLFAIGAAILGVNTWMELNRDDRRNDAQISDVRHFFHWSSILMPAQLQIVDSYLSKRSFGGDHLDAVCIKLVDSPGTPEWTEIRSLEKLFQGAVEMALNWASSEISCVPNFDAAKLARMVVLVDRVGFVRDNPQSAFIAVLDRPRNMVYFVSFKV